MTLPVLGGLEAISAQVCRDLIPFETAVGAFVESVGHVFGVEAGTTVREVENLSVIRHAVDMQHHHPRSFTFRHEFIVKGGNPMRVMHRLRRELTSPAEDHVLYVFTPDIDYSVHAYERFGYVHAWNNWLLGVEVARAGAPLVSRYFDVREFTVADLAAYESIGGPSSVARTLTDPRIHTFVSYDNDGEPVGRAQLVTSVDGIAYVSGIYTVPTSRRRGVGTGLMHAMHTRARREGATHCILVPSQEATELGFYPRFGYRTVAHHAVFVPDRDMDGSTNYES